MRCCIAPKIVNELSSTILPKKYHCNAQRENCFSLMLENVKKAHKILQRYMEEGGAAIADRGRTRFFEFQIQNSIREVLHRFLSGFLAQWFS